jgi:hypothetical protein
LVHDCDLAFLGRFRRPDFFHLALAVFFTHSLPAPKPGVSIGHHSEGLDDVRRATHFRGDGREAEVCREKANPARTLPENTNFPLAADGGF